MIAPWLLYATLLAALFGAAALGIGRIAQLTRRPTRGVWLAAVSAAVLAPLVGNLIASPAAPDAGAGWALAATSRLSLDTALLMLWAAASLLMITRLLTTMLQLRRRRRHWREAAIDGTPVLLTAEVGPALIGLAHPRPVIPEWALCLEARDRALMLLHEAEHARASDPWLLAIGALSVTLMPWNPALWWLVRRLRLAVEIDCDARVLRSGADARAYASLLLAVGERMSRSPFAWATALAEPRSQLEQRILAMTSPRISRRPALAITGLSAAAALALLVACEAPLPDQAVPTASVVAAPRASAPVTVVGRQLHIGDSVSYRVMENGVPATSLRVVQGHAIEAQRP